VEGGGGKVGEHRSVAVELMDVQAVRAGCLCGGPQWWWCRGEPVSVALHSSRWCQRMVEEVTGACMGLAASTAAVRRGTESRARRPAIFKDPVTWPMEGAWVLGGRRSLTSRLGARKRLLTSGPRVRLFPNAK
jgi:hypothetical protein